MVDVASIPLPLLLALALVLMPGCSGNFEVGFCCPTLLSMPCPSLNFGADWARGGGMGRREGGIGERREKRGERETRGERREERAAVQNSRDLSRQASPSGIRRCRQLLQHRHVRYQTRGLRGGPGEPRGSLVFLTILPACARRLGRRVPGYGPGYAGRGGVSKSI